MKSITQFIFENKVVDKILNNGDGIYLIPSTGAVRFTLYVCIVKDKEILELSKNDLKELHTEPDRWAYDYKFRYQIGTEKDNYYGCLGPKEVKEYISKEYNIDKMYFVCFDSRDKDFDEDDAKRVMKNANFECDGIITI